MSFMVTDWIFDDNLKAFLTALGWIAGYPFGPDDWEAVSCGVRENDGDDERWFEYEFSGPHPAVIRLAPDSGTCVVRVQISTPAEVEPQVRLAVAIFQHFRI